MTASTNNLRAVLAAATLVVACGASCTALKQGVDQAAKFAEQALNNAARESETDPQEGDAPVVAEARPPADGSQPPAEETQPPAEGTKPAADETPPPKVASTKVKPVIRSTPEPGEPREPKTPAAVRQVQPKTPAPPTAVAAASLIRRQLLGPLPSQALKDNYPAPPSSGGIAAEWVSATLEDRGAYLPIRLAPDLERLAAAERKGSGLRVRWNDAVGPSVDSIKRGFSISPNGERVAYLAMRSDKLYLGVDDGLFGPYTYLDHERFRWSSDSSRFLYLANTPEDEYRTLLFVDGELAEERPVSSAVDADFLAGTTELVYAIEVPEVDRPRQKRPHLVLGNQEFENVHRWTPAPGGTLLLERSTLKLGQERIWVEAHGATIATFGPHAKIHETMWSDDGSTIAVTHFVEDGSMRTPKDWTLDVHTREAAGGVTTRTFDLERMPLRVRLRSDGQRVTWEGAGTIVVDGRSSLRYKFVHASIFNASGKAVALVEKDGAFFRLEEFEEVDAIYDYELAQESAVRYSDGRSRFAALLTPRPKPLDFETAISSPGAPSETRPTIVYGDAGPIREFSSEVQFNQLEFREDELIFAYTIPAKSERKEGTYEFTHTPGKIVVTRNGDDWFGLPEGSETNARLHATFSPLWAHDGSRPFYAFMTKTQNVDGSTAYAAVLHDSSGVKADLRPGRDVRVANPSKHVYFLDLAVSPSGEHTAFFMEHQGEGTRGTAMELPYAGNRTPRTKTFDLWVDGARLVSDLSPLWVGRQFRTALVPHPDDREKSAKSHDSVLQIGDDGLVHVVVATERGAELQSYAYDPTLEPETSASGSTVSDAESTEDPSAPTRAKSALLGWEPKTDAWVLGDTRVLGPMAALSKGSPTPDPRDGPEDAWWHCIQFSGIHGREYSLPFRVGPNHAHWLAVVRAGSGWAVSHDGVLGQRFDAVGAKDGGHFSFSPDGSRWAYVGRRGRHDVLMVDGSEFGEFEMVDTKSWLWAPDSTNFYFRAQEDVSPLTATFNQGGRILNSDARMGTSATLSLLDDEGSTLIMTSGMNSKTFTWSNKEIPNVTRHRQYPNGTVAVISRHDKTSERLHLIRPNGEVIHESAPHEKLELPALGAEPSVFAYVYGDRTPGEVDIRWFIQHGERVLPIEQSVGYIGFSRDGKSLESFYRKGRLVELMLEGARSSSYESIIATGFDEQGRHVALASKNEAIFLTRELEEVEEYFEHRPWRCIENEDSTRFVAIVQGRPAAGLDGSPSVVFTEEGRCFDIPRGGVASTPFFLEDEQTWIMTVRTTQGSRDSARESVEVYRSGVLVARFDGLTRSSWKAGAANGLFVDNTGTRVVQLEGGRGAGGVSTLWINGVAVEERTTAAEKRTGKFTPPAFGPDGIATAWIDRPVRSKLSKPAEGTLVSLSVNGQEIASQVPLLIDYGTDLSRMNTHGAFGVLPRPRSVSSYPAQGTAKMAPPLTPLSWNAAGDLEVVVVENNQVAVRTYRKR